MTAYYHKVYNPDWSQSGRELIKCTCGSSNLHDISTEIRAAACPRDALAAQSYTMLECDNGHRHTFYRTAVIS